MFVVKGQQVQIRQRQAFCQSLGRCKTVEPWEAGAKIKAHRRKRITYNNGKEDEKDK